MCVCQVSYMQRAGLVSVLCFRRNLHGACLNHTSSCDGLKFVVIGTLHKMEPQVDVTENTFIFFLGMDPRGHATTNCMPLLTALQQLV